MEEWKNTFPTQLYSLEANTQLCGLNIHNTLLIVDDTRASACTRHMHEMCISMVLFLSHEVDSHLQDTKWNLSFKMGSTLM